MTLYRYFSTPCFTVAAGADIKCARSNWNTFYSQTCHSPACNAQLQYPTAVLGNAKKPRQWWFPGQAGWTSVGNSHSGDNSDCFYQQLQCCGSISPQLDGCPASWQCLETLAAQGAEDSLPLLFSLALSFCFGLKHFYFSVLIYWPLVMYGLELCLAVSADQKLLSRCLWLTPKWLIFFPSLSLRCFPVFQVPGLPLPMPRNTSGEEGNGFWCQHQNWWSSDGKITGDNDLSLVGWFFFLYNMVETYIEKLWILLKQEDFAPVRWPCFHLQVAWDQQCKRGV